MIYDLFDAHRMRFAYEQITRSVSRASLTIMDSNNQHNQNSWLFKFLSEDHSNDHHLLESYFRPNDLDYSEDPLALSENPLNLSLLPTSEPTTSSTTATSYLEHDLNKMEQMDDLNSLTDLFKFNTNPLSLNDPFFGHQDNYAPLYRCASNSVPDSLDFISFNHCPTEYSGQQNQWSSFESTTTTTNVTVIQNPSLSSSIDDQSFGVLNPGPLVHDQELLSQWSAFIESRSGTVVLDQQQVGSSSQIPRIQDSDQFLTQQWSAFIESRFSSGSITSELDRLLSIDHAHLLLGFHDSGIHENPIIEDQIDSSNLEVSGSIDDHVYQGHQQPPIKVTKMMSKRSNKNCSKSNSTRKPVRLTPEQKEAVERAFQENPRPRSYSDLSERLGLSKLRTMSCFRYHRVKQKKILEKEHESEREQKYQNYLTNLKSEICDSEDEDFKVPENPEDSYSSFGADAEIEPLMPSLFSNLISMYLSKLDFNDEEEEKERDDDQGQDIEVNNLDCEVSHVASNVILA